MLESLLIRIGLTRNEATLYLLLLETGTMPAGALIKKIGMHRTAVYDLLDRLQEKGLVSSVVIDTVRQFKAIDPSQLLDYLDERQELLETHKEELKEALPRLRALQKPVVSLEATLFKGKRALKTLADEAIASGQPFFIYGAEGKFKELLPVYYSIFHKKRLQRRIPIKIIYRESVRRHKREKELRLFSARYIPDEHETPATTWIYGNTVLIIVWGSQPVITRIVSDEVARSYRSNFSLLWNLAEE
jgi:sugar-specific transcriptional regulator TrmB